MTTGRTSGLLGGQAGVRAGQWTSGKEGGWASGGQAVGRKIMEERNGRKGVLVMLH